MHWHVFASKPGPNNSPSTPLGPADAIREAISEQFPGTDWEDLACGDYDGDEFAIEFKLGGAEHVEQLDVEVRGDGNPVPHLTAIATRHEWRLRDVQANIDIAPSQETCDGWERFKQERDLLFGIDTRHDDVASSVMLMEKLLQVLEPGRTV